MEIAEYIDALRHQGDLLAGAADRSGLEAAVPSCPQWLVKDLVRHTGYIHRWAMRHITERPSQVIDGPPEEEILRGGPPDPSLLAWFRAGHAALVGALAAADPAVECAAFLSAPSPLAFWARRQAHETAIHRADAELAGGMLPEYPAEFAADGIDELIMGFGQRRKYQPQAGPASGGGLLRMVSADTGDTWSITARQGLLQPRRETGAVTAAAETTGCTVTGPASGLYLFLWNRAGAAAADITVTGDPTLLASWQGSVKIRWN